MLYQLKHGGDKSVPDSIVNQAISRNLPIPDKTIKDLTDSPEVRIDLQFFFNAFMELNTCRSIGMNEGPIPWTAMITYCEVLEIDRDERERFIYLVRKMDEAYLSYRADEMKKEHKQMESKVKQSK